jgi:protein associated with RNAse G/E
VSKHYSEELVQLTSDEVIELMRFMSNFQGSMSREQYQITFDSFTKAEIGRQNYERMKRNVR